MKSMWFEIRTNAGLSQEQVAKYFKASKQYVSQLENGKYMMPVKYQIYYLSLRNTPEDRIVIKHLKKLQNMFKEKY